MSERFEWQRTRLKYIADCNRDVLPESTDPDESFLYVDISAVTQGELEVPTQLTRFAEAASRARRLAVPGDTVVSTVRTYLRAVATVPASDHPLVFSTGFAVLHPFGPVDPRFLSWYLQGDELVSRVEAVSTGVSYPAITATELMSFDLLLPERATQRGIADYLDRETAQIDTLIAKQEQLIATLRERRNAVSEVLLADRIRNGDRLKWSVNEIDHRAGTRWSELPLLSVSITWGVRRRDEMTDDVPRAEDLSMYKLVDRGAVVINRMRAFQGALGVAGEAGIVSPDYAVLQPGSAIDAHWLAALMRTQTFVAEMSSRLKGIGGTEGGAVRTPRINVDDLLDIVVDLPSLSHQEDDLRSMTLQTSKIDTLISKAEQFIALAKERRSALITAAVTGQIDVTGKAA